MKLRHLIFGTLLCVCSCNIIEEVGTFLPYPPTVPDGVRVVAVEDETSIQVAWNDAENAIGYSYILQDRHGNLVDAGKTSETGLTFSGLNKGYQYLFAVKSYNKALESEYSSKVPAIPGGELMEPYGVFALQLYSLDGDIKIDTLTVLIGNEDLYQYSAGFKGIEIGADSLSFNIPYVPEGDYNHVEYKVRYSRMKGDQKVDEDYSIIVTNEMKVVCDTINRITAPILAYDEDDFYSVYYHGKEIQICDQIVTRKEYPTAKVLTMAELSWDVLAAPLDDEVKGGILFIDNSTNAYKATAANRTFGKDKIVIGRYRNDNQPIFKMNTPSACMWSFEGKAMLKNITLSAFQTSRCLFAGKSGSAHGVSEFYFEDCTLTNSSASYGVFTELNPAFAMPKSMQFENCILRANASFFGVSGRTDKAEADVVNDYFASAQHLKSLIFDNCVFAPATLDLSDTTKLDVWNGEVKRLQKRGVIVAFYHPNYRFDELDITMSNCSSYNLGPDASVRGLIDATSLRKVTVDHCVLYHSSVFNNLYLVNVLQTCSSEAALTVSETYSNTVSGKKMSYGPKSKFTGNGGTCTASIKTGEDLFGECYPKNHYFPLSASMQGVAGASYDTKYWITVPEVTPEL